MFLVVAYLLLLFEILYSILVGKFTKQYKLLLYIEITVQVCYLEKRNFNTKYYLKLDPKPTLKD